MAREGVEERVVSADYYARALEAGVREIVGDILGNELVREILDARLEAIMDMNREWTLEGLASDVIDTVDMIRAAILENGIDDEDVEVDDTARPPVAVFPMPTNNLIH